MARTIRQSDFAPHDNKNDFVPQDLIEKLTASVDLKEQQNSSNASSSSRKGFIPRPYLLKFEHAIDQIRTLRTDIDIEINKQTLSCKEDESLYKSSLSGFMTDLQKIMHDFRILDGGISKVSQTAIRIGDRLETVEDQRQEILSSEELIEHFLRFNKDKKYRDIDPIFYAESGDNLYRAAKLIIKLHEIGTDLTLPETQNARDEIQLIANRIKKNLREEFIRAYQAKREDNYIEMKECATILDEFNDKTALHEFLNLYLRDINFNKYPSTSYTEVSKSIIQFKSDLSRVIETAMVSIYKVFPSPQLVIKDLIIKVFNEQILSYLLNATQPILLGHQLDEKMDIENDNNNYLMDEAQISMQRSSNLREMNILQPQIGTGGTDDPYNKLSKKELSEYLSIINIVYKYTNNLLKDIRNKLLYLIEGDDIDAKYSITHILEENKLLSIIFSKHQENYLKLECKHLKNSLKELIREHVILALKLEDHDLLYDSDQNEIENNDIENNEDIINEQQEFIDDNDMTNNNNNKHIHLRRRDSDPYDLHRDEDTNTTTTNTVTVSSRKRKYVHRRNTVDLASEMSKEIKRKGNNNASVPSFGHGHDVHFSFFE
eukprot:366471_1